MEKNDKPDLMLIDSVEMVRSFMKFKYEVTSKIQHIAIKYNTSQYKATEL